MPAVLPPTLAFIVGLLDDVFGSRFPVGIKAAGQILSALFLVFGDAYLADSSRTWDSLSSDEMHAFFQRLQRVYGWEVFKRWYRTYRRLIDAGLKPPTKSEEKINLIAAILSHEAHVDLVPVFQRWRFPVTPAGVAAMKEKYGIGRG